MNKHLGLMYIHVCSYISMYNYLDIALLKEFYITGFRNVRRSI